MTETLEERLREVAMLCGCDGQMFTADCLREAADAITKLNAELDDAIKQRDNHLMMLASAARVITAMQTELDALRRQS